MEILARQSFDTTDQTDTIFFRQTVHQQDIIYQQTKFAVQEFVIIIDICQDCFIAVAAKFDWIFALHKFDNIAADSFAVNFHSIFRFQ